VYYRFLLRSGTLPRTILLAQPHSATGQQDGYQNIAEQIALRLGLQSGLYALVQILHGCGLVFRLSESRFKHRLGDGPDEAGIRLGVPRHVAAPPELEEKRNRNFYRLGAIDRKRAANGGVHSFQRREQFRYSAEIRRERQAFVILSFQ